MHGTISDALESAIIELRSHQTQLDMDGVMVGVSRQALEEVLDALSASPGSSAGAEPFAWHWWAKNHSETWPVWSQGAERPAHAPDSAIALYKHQPSAPPQREGLEEAAWTLLASVDAVLCELKPGQSLSPAGAGRTNALISDRNALHRALTGKGGE